MYKLISSDFDGTLVDKEESIPLSTVLAIDNVRRQGVKFIISTGRVRSSVMEYNKDFHFIDYVISCNGANVYDVKNGKDLFVKKLAKNILKEIEKNFGANDIYFCKDEDWFFYENKMIAGVPFSDWIKNSEDIRKIEINFKNKKEAVLGIEKLNGLNIDAKFNIAHYGKQYLIEVTSSDVNKYIGLTKLLKHLKIKENEVLAIGDSYNDLEILENIENSVAVKNAVSEVKKVAKYKTESNNHKGVEKIIKKLILTDREEEYEI